MHIASLEAMNQTMPGVLWTNEELRAALEAYLFTLRLNQAGIDVDEDRIITLLQTGPLDSRNAASIRYRMRNISAVLADLKRPTLREFPPADKVGTGVQLRIEAMLLVMPWSGITDMPAQPASRKAASTRAKRALSDLAAVLCDLDRGVHGIGHNNPPGSIDPSEPPETVNTIILLVDWLRQEVSASAPRPDELRKGAEALTRSAVRSTWLRERGTKAIDAAIEQLAPTLMMTIALLLANAVIALFRLVAFL